MSVDRKCFVLAALVIAFSSVAHAAPSEEQLARWLEKYPQADANGDGTLTEEEAAAYRQKLTAGEAKADTAGAQTQISLGNPPELKIDSGWEAERFPEHAICHLLPAEIAAAYAKAEGKDSISLPSYDKPADGSLRIVATGHSFMAPAFRTFPHIARAAGLEQPPLMTHTGGGVTGSARYKWEQENGIFGFDRRPTPKLLAAISHAEWDAMLWGPYYHDRPAYYECWIDFCLKYNPAMKFYLMDAWPQIGQLQPLPKSDAEFSAETITKMGEIRHKTYASLVAKLNQKYNDRVFILPTCDAMVLAGQHYHRGELPGVEGIHTLAGRKQRTLWRDMIGHLGPGFDQLEGYVFYATLYGRSPELIEGNVSFGGSGDYPSQELDRVFRKIAWQAVVNHPLSGVKDRNADGIGD